jgi:hypothetical protein
VNATLVDHNTNQTIPNTLCTAFVGDESYSVQTDNNGETSLSTTSDQGTVEIVFTWDGTGYTLGTETTQSIQSIPLQVILPPETVLVRGERSIIKGQVKAEEIPGNLEPISFSVLGDSLSTVTNEHGEFFIAKTIPPTRWSPP